MEPKWEALENRLGRARCAGFMYMGRINGIHLYKHGIARLSLALDDYGQCFTARGSTFERADFNEELAKIVAALSEVGETLESSYDEQYIARKQDAFRRAGLPLFRIQIEPEDITLN